MNFTPIIQKYLQWHDRRFPMGNILRHTQYILVFKTTHYCWYSCPHCCESCGPDRPRTYIPATLICQYLDQAKQDPMFSNNVVFTGGEIMSAYRFGPADYVPTLLNKSMDLGIGTDIKTNAAWARAGFGEKIFSDLHDVVSSHKPYSLQISLSLDRYHKNALENNARLISHLAKMPDMPVVIHIAGFNGHIDMVPALVERLKSEKISVEDVMLGNTKKIRPARLINGQILMHDDRATLFDGGRAKNMDWAQHAEFPQFKFLTSDMQSLIAFDAAGRVTLGENSGRKISTSYVLRRPGLAKSIFQVRSDLVSATWREELRARIFEGWRFNSK